MANQYGLNNKKVFITGGAGFIATKAASVLADDNEIILYDNLHNNAFQNTTLSQHSNVRFVQGDILDAEALNKAIDADVDYIIHCAAIAGVDTVINNPMMTLKVNIQGVFNIFDAALRVRNLKRVIDFSTSEVFGQYAYCVDEAEVNPRINVGEARWTYAMSKLAGEFITHAHHVQENLPTVTVRPFNVYGPNQVGVGAIHHFVVNALANKTLWVHDDGAQIRSWCYVDDFVHALLLATVNENAIGKTYNIGNPRSTLTVYHLAHMIKNRTDSQSSIVFKKLGYEDVKVRIPSIEAARRDLNFEPQVELEDGLARTIDWYRRKLICE